MRKRTPRLPSMFAGHDHARGCRERRVNRGRRDDGRSAGDDAEDLVDLALGERPAELGCGDHEPAGELDLVEHRIVTKTGVELLWHQGAPESGTSMSLPSSLTL